MDTSFNFGANAPAPQKRVDVRRRSLKVLQQVTDEGLLSERQTTVYIYLYEHGPLTAGELTAAVGTGYHRRLSELERRGAVRRVASRKCKVTGRLAVTWDVTDQVPGPDVPDGGVKIKQALAVGEDAWHASASFARKLGFLPDRATDVIQRPGEWTLVVVMADGERWQASGINLPGGALLTKWE